MEVERGRECVRGLTKLMLRQGWTMPLEGPTESCRRLRLMMRIPSPDILSGKPACRTPDRGLEVQMFDPVYSASGRLPSYTAPEKAPGSSITLWPWRFCARSGLRGRVRPPLDSDYTTQSPLHIFVNDVLTHGGGHGPMSMGSTLNSLYVNCLRTVDTFGRLYCSTSHRSTALDYPLV